MSSYKKIINSCNLEHKIRWLCFLISILACGIFLFQSCGVKSKYSTTSNIEDTSILEAFAALDTNNPKKAVESFLKAYDYTKNTVYLQEAISIAMQTKQLQTAKDLINNFLKNHPDNMQMRTNLISVLVMAGDFNQAEQEALKLLEQKRDAENLELTASVYFLKQDYKKAASYLEETYALNHSEKILDRLSSTLVLFLNDSKKAQKLLETHTRLYQCSVLLCTKLALLYQGENDFSNAAKTYEKLYYTFIDTEEAQQYARSAIGLYARAKEYKQAQNFLLKNPSIENQAEMLLEFYQLNKDYKLAMQQAKKLYNQTKKPDFLVASAVLEYESATNKNDKTMLKRIANDLESVIDKVNNPIYWNFLGYLLIDHNIDIKKGIQYVEKALQEEPDSLYYLDSLAWGYYKLKDCQKAQEIFQLIPEEEIQQEEELLEHFNRIKTCAK